MKRSLGKAAEPAILYSAGDDSLRQIEWLVYERSDELAAGTRAMMRTALTFGDVASHDLIAAKGTLWRVENQQVESPAGSPTQRNLELRRIDGNAKAVTESRVVAYSANGYAAGDDVVAEPLDGAPERRTDYRVLGLVASWTLDGRLQTLDAGDAPAGNEQVIQLPATGYQEYSLTSLKAVTWTAAAPPAVIDALKRQAADKRYIWSLAVVKQTNRDGRLTLTLSDSSQERNILTSPNILSNAFESGGQISIESGGSRLTVGLVNSLPDGSTYDFTPGNVEIEAFIDAVSARAGSQAATLTLRDFVK